MLSVFVSMILLPSLFFPLAPVLQQGMAAAGITLVQRVEALDAVGPETAEILPRLAPCQHHPHQIEKSEREGPDHPLRQFSLLVAIGHHDLALLANNIANGGEIDVDGGHGLPGADKQGGIIELLTQGIGQNGGDLDECGAGGLRQALIGTARDPSRPEHKRLDLLLRKHQRRQQKTGTQHITHTRLALDVSTLRLKRCYIAVKRAQADAGLRGQRHTADRHAVGAQDLQQIKKPL